MLLAGASSIAQRIMADRAMSNSDKRYISEDESAGYASPALDIVAAVALSALSIWIMVESMALKSPAAWGTSVYSPRYPDRP